MNRDQLQGEAGVGINRLSSMLKGKEKKMHITNENRKYQQRNTRYKKVLRFWKMAARQMGAEPTCSCTQLGHLADLLKNREKNQ